MLAPVPPSQTPSPRDPYAPPQADLGVALPSTKHRIFYAISALTLAISVIELRDGMKYLEPDSKRSPEPSFILAGAYGAVTILQVGLGAWLGRLNNRNIKNPSE